MFQSIYDTMISGSRWVLMMRGLGITILIAVCAVLIGTVLGCIFALMKISGKKVLKAIADIYTTVIRGIPLATQLMIFYFVVFAPLGLNRLLVAIIAYGINSGAYCTEIFRAGIQSIDKGQMEASRSLGLSYGVSMRKVILPQAFRVMIPSIINQFIITLKDTSILSVIGYPELTNMGKTISGNTFKSLQTWAIVGIMYMIVIVTLSKVAKNIERKIKINDQQ